MTGYWAALSGITRFFYFVAVPATAVLLIQLVMNLIGLGAAGDSDIDSDAGAGDAGIDLDGDGQIDAVDTSYEHSYGGGGDFRVFTLKGIVAFLAVFGWTGAAMSGAGMQIFFTVAVSIVAGAAAMTLVGLMFYGITKLQADGTLSPKNAVGQEGKVYLRVPGQRAGSGKVNVLVQERLSELPAITYDAEDILPGAGVRVTGVTGEGMLVVTRVT